jgi:hypothetical protein
MGRDSMKKVKENYYAREIQPAAKAVETTWTVKEVDEYFREAVLTLKMLPPVKQRGYFSVWPDIVYMPNEKIFQEKMPKKILATPDSISRLDKTFEWMAWITVEERKLIWKRASRVRWKTICWELGLSRVTIWKQWQMACTKIATTLNATVSAKNIILQNKKCLNNFVVYKNHKKEV